MSDRHPNPEDSGAESAAEPRILFSSAYGGFPRFVWFAVIPLLLLFSAAVFIDAVWFDGQFLLQNARMSPNLASYVICPAIWGVCGLIMLLEIYRHLHPQFILVSTWGLRVPKGRFTSENIAIAWDDLNAMLEGTNFKGMQVYEFHFEDVRSGARARVTSALFRRYAEFATFATILGEQMGREWPIKGVAARGPKRTGG
jgi:hypothetical protein